MIYTLLRMNVLFQLFITFFKIGAFTFGGGYAMLPIVEDICVSRKKWITHDEMMYITVIAESTPGPIAINLATYIGYKQKGFIGSLFATIGIVLPSLLIIYVISIFLEGFLEIKVVDSAFKGIAAAVGILIVNAGITMSKKMKKNWKSIFIFTSSAVIMLLSELFGWKVSSIVIMIIFGCFSLSVFAIQEKKKKEAEL